MLKSHKPGNGSKSVVDGSLSLVTSGAVTISNNGTETGTKETEIGTMPTTWHVKTLGECSTFITKGASPRWQGFDYCTEGIRFIRAQNVGDGRLELADVVYLNP